MRQYRTSFAGWQASCICWSEIVPHTVEMPRRKKTVRNKQKVDAASLALTLQKLYAHEPALAETVREYALHSEVVPGLVKTAREHIETLLRRGPYVDLHLSPEMLEQMSAASDALARAAALSKSFVPGKVRALRRSALPPGATLVPNLTPKLTAAEYRRLWDQNRITYRSGPGGLNSKDMLSANPPPGMTDRWYMSGLSWPSDVMSPSNYELHKLATALRLLEEAREGIDTTPVVEELPDAGAGAAKGGGKRRHKKRTRSKGRKRGRATRRTRIGGSDTAPADPLNSRTHHKAVLEKEYHQHPWHLPLFSASSVLSTFRK